MSESQCFEIIKTEITDHVEPVAWTLLLAAIGAAALTLLYKRIKTDWPESYTSVETGVDEQLRENPLRSHLVFRGGPVFLVSSFVTVMIERNDGWPWAGVILLLLLHLLHTNFKAAANLLRAPRDPRWTVLLIHHAYVSIAVITAGIVACTFRGRLAGLIPNNTEILTSMWSGLFAALFIVGVRTVMTPRQLSSKELLEKLKTDIGKNNWSYIDKVAGDNEQLLKLMKAILLAEAQQRPRWFRRLERIKGLIHKPGTYGVAQVASPKPISDLKSIDRLASRLGKHTIPTKILSNADEQALQRILLEHNPDESHAAAIVSFFWMYDPSDF